MKRTKIERHALLQKTIANNPFVTDDELSQILNVSIQTIRLDRMELAIPELRERIKLVAKNSLTDEIRSLPVDEIIGDIIDITVGKRAISMFDVKAEHVFKRNRIARGHYIFAQANSLAVAIVNNELALTTKADIRFLKQVREGDRIIAKATVCDDQAKSDRIMIHVESFVDQTCIFTGDFELFHSNKLK